MPKAWQLLADMKKHDIVPDNFTYSTLIKGIKVDNRYQSGNIQNYQDLERAFDMLREMEEMGQVRPDEILYNCLIDVCVRFRDLNRAIEVFNQMKLHDAKPSSVTYGILIKAYG